MLAPPPPGSGRPLLGEILDPPLIDFVRVVRVVRGSVAMGDFQCINFEAIHECKKNLSFFLN